MDVMTSRGRGTGRATSLLIWALLAFVVGGFCMWKLNEKAEARKAHEAEVYGESGY